MSASQPIRFNRHNPRSTKVLIAAAAAVMGGQQLLSSGMAHAALVTWIGPTTGNWGTNTNWSNSAVPGGGDDVRIDGTASIVTVSTGASTSRSANNLMIDTGDALQIDNGSTMNLGGNLLVNGTLKFASNPNESFLSFSSPTATISGAGGIDFSYVSGSPTAGVIQTFGSGAITNQTSIRGAGTLRNIKFTNSATGLLENYDPGAQLYLDPNNSAAGLFINQGTIRALTGATVTMTGDNGGDMNSTGGNIQANGAGAVFRFINSASVTGGNYSTTSGGEIAVEAGQTAFASPQSLSGTWRLRNGSTLHINGTMNNNGMFQLSPAGSGVTYDVNAPLTLNGTGGINGNYTGTGPGSAVTTSTNLLTLGSGQTVTGVVAFQNAKVTNNGVIDANDGTSGLVGAGMYIDPNNNAGGLFVNNGTMRASSGGIMQIVGDNGGDTINNGTISSIGTNSVVELLNNSSVTGGTWTSSSGGVLRVRPGHIGNLASPTITAGTTFLVPATTGQTQLNLSGNLPLDGTLKLDAQNGNLSLLSLPAAVNMTGSGTLLGTYGGVGVGPRIDAATGTLNIGTNNTVQGVIFFNNARVNNNGLIDANNAAGMYIDPNNAAAGLFVNNNTMRATSGGLMTITGDNGGDLINNGTISSIGANSLVELHNSITVSGGTWTSSGGGALRVRPGQTASLINPTITAGSTFNVSSTGTQTVQLNLSGNVPLNGTLKLDANGQLPVLSLPGAVTLSGSGTLLGTYSGIPATPGPRIDAATGTLNIGTNNTVQGVIYFNNARVNNNGLIDANNAAGMLVDPNNTSAGLFVNNNTMRASSGGLMVIAGDAGGDTINNGTISSIGANSIVELYNSATVTGGTWSSSGGGVLRVRPGQVGNLANPNIAAGSTFSVPATTGQTTLNLSGPVTLNGILNLDAQGQLSLLSLPSAVTLSGTGAIKGTFGGTGNGPRIDAATGTLTIGAGNTVQGVMFFNNARVINNGTILADALPNMYIDPNNQAADLFVNNGTMRATNGATMILVGDAGGNFAGAGPLIVDANSTIQATNSVSGLMGPVSGAGTYNTTNSSTLTHTNFRVGTLSVTNSATARVATNGGNTGASRVGTLTINTSGKLDLNDNDLVATATPVPAIQSMIVSGRNGGLWNGSGITSGAAASAVPKNKTLGLLSGSEYISVAGTSFDGFTIAPTDAVVKFTYYGDTDFNGLVNFDDYSRTDAGFNNLRSGWLNGDFDYNGLVNFDDYALIDLGFNTQSGTLRNAMSWLGGDHQSDAGMGSPALRMVEQHYQQFGDAYANSFFAAVPEPTAGLSIGVPVMTMILKRRRRNV